MQETGFSASPDRLAGSVGDFAGARPAYYGREFEKIQSAVRFPWSWNTAAALAGPFWGAARGLWGFFWTFLVLEVLALVQIGRGWWGELGADKLARLDKLTLKYNEFLAKHEAAKLAGDPDAASFLKRAENLEKIMNRVAEEAALAAQGAVTILATGLVLLIGMRLVQGFYANLRYEKQYLGWRADPAGTASGLSWTRAGLGALLWLAIVPLTLYRFTVGKIAPGLEPWVAFFPVEKKSYYAPVSTWMDGGFDWLSVKGAGVFDGIVAAIRAVLDGLETVFVDTPWPVVMTVIVVVAWRLAGPRVAVFTGAALAYLALFGLWETSMVTVSLLGAAAFLCVLIGIPLGVWFGKSQRAYNAALPVLDFMQTMPAFVYLIPIIAFFGTGKPPGVLATLVFGMPPVIRLTALGIRGGAGKHQGGRDRVRLHPVDAAQGHRDPAGDAVDHDRRQPDHPDVPVDGGHRLADRRQGPGPGRARRAAVRGQGPGDAGGPRDPVLRDGHRPHRAGALQALDRAPPARAVARPATIPESRPRPG